MSNKSSAVNILAALGVFWDVSNTIMGIMILAPANSIGDYVADTALARSGKGVTAFGAVYSGPLLNLLIGVGLRVTWSIFFVKIWFSHYGVYGHL